MNPHEQNGGMLCFFCCFITSEEGLSIEVDAAVTKFTPVNPKVSSGLKQTLNFSVNYPFNVFLLLFYFLHTNVLKQKTNSFFNDFNCIQG